jgi:hypothetical protein
MARGRSGSVTGLDRPARRMLADRRAPVSSPRRRMSARRIIRLLGQGGHETSGKSVKNPPPQGRIARRIGFDLTVGAGWWERPTCRPLLQTPQNRPLPGQGRVETRLSREEVGQSERNGGRGRFACGAPPSPGALLLPGRPHHTCYESSSGKNLWSASPSPGCDSGCNSSAAT